MSQHTQAQLLSLKEAERKAYRLSTSQDGLYDIFIGSYIGLLSAAPWLDEKGLHSPWNVVLVFILGLVIFFSIMLIKKFTIAPRIGQVRYGTERKKRIRNLAIGMAVIFLITLGLFGVTIFAIYFREPIFRGRIEWALPIDPVHTAAGIFIFAIFCMIGYMKDYARLYFYGFLFGLSYIISTTLQDITGNPFYWPWALAGLIAVIIGSVLFVHFLQKYPLAQEINLETNG